MEQRVRKAFNDYSCSQRILGSHDRPYLDIFVLKRLDIEPDCGNRLHSFVAFILQSVQDRCLPGIIQAKDQDPYLLRPKKGLKDSAHHNTHGRNLRQRS